MDRVLSRQLRNLDPPARLDLARDVIMRLTNRFDSAVCSLLVEELAGVETYLAAAWCETLPDTANAAWLRTRLLSDAVALAAAWERFFDLQPRRDPFDLLAFARALAATGACEDAVRTLRLALAQDVPYTFFARAQHLVTTLAASAQSNLRQCRIALLGSTTTSLFVPVIKALCLRDRIGVEIYDAPYSSIEQEILDPNSGLARFRPQIVALVMHWRDLHLEAGIENEPEWIARTIEDTKQRWRRLSDTLDCHVIQPAFDYPAAEPYGPLAGLLPGGRTRMIERLNLRLREEAPAQVSILDVPAAQREVGAKRWADQTAWIRYRQHPSPEALPELAEAYMSHVRAVLGLSRKVLITDLDNTLWGGVIGEDGLDAIRIGPDTPEGEAHLDLQRYILDLKRRGILLAVCSKNNPDDAKLPFREHPHMALRLEDFAAFRANWDDKVANLRAIAADLSLGLDSFVLVDDNPLEREWVRSQLPEVAVVELGPSPFSHLRELDRGRYFEALWLTQEDLARADQYRVRLQRETLRTSADSLEGFLQTLQLEAGAEEITDKNIQRITQLVNKTNQFNFTTRRYTEAQVRAIADDPRGWARAFRMSDRMGSYGLIGVLFCRPTDCAWEIDTWLMSCRALGRRMEKFMFDRLVEAAIERRISRIVGVYRPTPKNALVQDLYGKLAFRRIASTEEEVRYELQLHHVGYVVASVESSVAEYTKSSGLVWNGRITHDPLQMVRVAFLQSAGDGTAMIELVEPAGRRSPVNSFLARGGGLHHICLEVDELTAEIEAMQRSGGTLVRVPLPAAAFGRRKIAWIKTSAGQLIELLQK